MRRRSIFGFALLALTLAAVRGGTQQADRGRSSLPATLDSASTHAAYPIWVAASAMSRDFRELEPRTRAYILGHVGSKEHEEGGCISFVPNRISPRYAKPSGDLEDLVQYSWDVLAGVVEDTAYGFFQDEPGLMLEIRVSESLKLSDSYRAGAPVRVFLRSVGDFVAGGLRFCASNPFWEPPFPEIGDRILAFPYYEPPDAAKSVIWPLEEEVFFEAASTRGLRLSSSWKARIEQQGIRDLDQLRERAHELHERAQKGIER